MAGDPQTNGLGIDQNVIDGLIASGAPPEIIASATASFSGQTENDCDVWPDNWRSVLLFRSVGTQWQIAPSGKRIGINYQSVESLMNMQNIRKHRRGSLMNDIRFMEEIALSVFREKE
ncbi:protein of unknown function DUF1799 phage-related protein [Nitrosomonas sp. Is79A3]|uniref:DUF1799 domain-containing protein n=1 Tax=Nitrosomonas sp. (strain Is79A3) TaxID=261292 RepID=UPI000215CA1F